MNRVESASLFQLFGLFDGFLIRAAFKDVISVRSEELSCDAVEGHHLSFCQLREEDLTVVSQNAGEETDLTGFLG